jgi:hypothetical protein
MSDKSSNCKNSLGVINKKKSIDTIPCRIEFIKNLLHGTEISSLVDFENTDTEQFVGGNNRDENESGESHDTRKVLKKRFHDFAKTIMSIGGDEKQLEYIKSGTTGHTFKGSVKDKVGIFEYGVKVVAFPKREKYGNIYDVRRPENAELKMIKVLSYFVVKKQTPHVVLPIASFDTGIKIFTTKDFMEVVGEDNEKYQDFLSKYEDGEYDDNVSILISEWANRGDLLELLRKFYNKPIFTANHWKSIFFQILSVLAVIQSKYPSFRHNDLKANNVLVHKLEKQDEYFAYRIARKKYKVINIGYQVKLWDFDFACIPGVVDNKKVELQWTSQINVKPVQNKYYDVHYFFNTLIKKGFIDKLMTCDVVPQEVKDFINRVVPKKYQIDPKAIALKKTINQGLIDKCQKYCDKYEELYNQAKIENKSAKKKEYHELLKKYTNLLEIFKDNENGGYGSKFIHNYHIPSEIKSMIMEIIPQNHGILLGYVHEKGRLLMDDEYLTPLQILEEDPYFEEYRVRDDDKEYKRDSKKEGSDNKYIKQVNCNKNGLDISTFLNKKNANDVQSLAKNKKKKNSKKSSKKKNKKKKVNREQYRIMLE